MIKLFHIKRRFNTFGLPSINLNVTTSINYLLLIYAFLLPISYVAIKSLTTLLFLLWLVEGNFKHKFSNIFSNKSIIWFLIFSFYALFSLLWVDSNLKEAFVYIASHKYILIFIIIYTSVNRKNITKLINAFILGVIVSMIVSYGIYFELINMGYNHGWYGKPYNPTPFMDHLDYSIILAIVANIFLYKIVSNKIIFTKIISIILFFSVVINLFIAGGRIGQLAFFVTMFIVLTFKYKDKILKAIGGSILVVSVLAIIIFNTNNNFKTKMLHSYTAIESVLIKKDYHSSWGARAAAWIVSFDIVKNSTFFGVGAKDNLIAFKNTIKSKYPEFTHIMWFPHLHSEYLEIVTSMGLVGLILFLLILYELSKIPIKNVEIKNLKYIFLSIFLIGFFADPFLEKTYILPLFGFLYGIIVSKHKYESLNH